MQDVEADVGLAGCHPRLVDAMALVVAVVVELDDAFAVVLAARSTAPVALADLVDLGVPVLAVALLARWALLLHN